MAVEVSSEADETTLGFDARNRNEASSDDGAHEVQEEGDEKSKDRRHEVQEKAGCSRCESICEEAWMSSLETLEDDCYMCKKRHC